MTMPADESVCSFHQFGHCKFGSFCRKKHTIQTCKNYPCSVDKCPDRHPRPCKYFLASGHCKFFDDCSYLHLGNPSEHEMQKEISLLKTEIEALKVAIEEMKVLLKLSPPKRHQESVLSSEVSFQTLLSRVPVTSTNSSSSITSIPEAIPQYDGLEISHERFDSLNSSAGKENHKLLDLIFHCEFCSKTFETKETLKEHNAINEFCCDECDICYKTQVDVDLHELEVHPGTDYANTQIPYSTKILFEQSKNKKP